MIIQHHKVPNAAPYGTLITFARGNPVYCPADLRRTSAEGGSIVSGARLSARINGPERCRCRIRRAVFLEDGKTLGMKCSRGHVLHVRAEDESGV